MQFTTYKNTILFEIGIEIQSMQKYDCMINKEI